MPRSPWIVLGLSSALFACVTDAPQPELIARAIGPAQRCLNPQQIVARRPLGPRAVLFETAGGRSYRNELQHDCPGLARANSSTVLSFEIDAGEICANDNFRALDPVVELNAGPRGGPFCRLGNFVPIDNGRSR